jgi:outer membrane protein assembly factor BamA
MAGKPSLCSSGGLMRKILDRGLALALFLAPLAAWAQAASTERPAARGWEKVGLPALNYNTDEGFGYGVLAELYNYGDGVRPYKVTIQPTIFFTTKGRRDVVVFFDAPHVLPNDWRFDISVAREQQLANPYYGVGNDTPYDSSLENGPNPYYYRYGKTQTRAYVNAQHRIGKSSARYLIGYGFAHVKTDATPFDSGTTLFGADNGAPSGRIGFLRTGIIWDTRDREIGPTRGTWAELLAQRVDGAVGASNDYTRVTGTVRQYVSLSPKLVLAVRLLAQQSTGDVPVYDLNTFQSSYKNQEGLGGDKSLRGIPRTRYSGKGILLENTELRWRFKEFSLFGKPMFLLASGFVDAGRVWTNSINLSEMATDLHVGYGGGLRIGLGQSFVVALDFGTSKESSQLYIGLGYLF